MYVAGFRRLFEMEGYVLESVKVSEDLAQVRVRRDRRFSLTCPECGENMAENRRSWQNAKDLPLGPALNVLIIYEAIQGRCSECQKYRTVRPDQIPANAQATWRLMSFVSALCARMPPSRVSEILPISPSSAYRWDKRVLAEELPEPQLDGLHALLIDEKSIGKHHQYVTLVWNGRTGELLHMAEGKKKESLKAFFEKLTDKQKHPIEAAAIDRTGAFKSVLEEEVPEADIVFDKFHLIKNYHDVIDTVRRQEWRNAQEKDKDVIKGQRYNLFRNPDNRTAEQQRELDELLEVNRNLHKVYVLKDEFRKLWTYVRRDRAAGHLAEWAQWAKDSGLEALENFADSLLEAKEQVLNYFKHEITLGPLEGFNNLVSRIIHRACGYSDMRYLYLKLRKESLDFVLQS